MNTRIKMVRRIIAWMVTLTVLLGAAADSFVVSAAAPAGAGAKEGWRIEKQRLYYYSNGKKLSGFKELNGKYHYFDKTGVQHTGWQKMRGNYYFFRIENGEKGYMVTSKKVNGVTLQYNGKAKKTKKNIEKLKTMLKANKFLEKATKPTMKKYDKLKSCFQYSIENFKYRGSPRFVRSKNWENKYALDMFDKGHGNCYAYGAAFAFLANAAGYTDVYAISSGGHGWAEVKGKVFDPSWEIVDKKHHYFNMSYKLSGKDGRPNYKKHRRYAKKI